MFDSHPGTRQAQRCSSDLAYGQRTQLQPLTAACEQFFRGHAAYTNLNPLCPPLSEEDIVQMMI